MFTRNEQDLSGVFARRSRICGVIDWLLMSPELMWGPDGSLRTEWSVLLLD